jgi:hypothetical protein
MRRSFKLRAGEWVEIRGKEEILRTLDKKGQLNGQPFMPQMFKYCGQRFRVFKRAHKTCDTVFPVRGRRVVDSVHLETRCDGEAYGGCQAGCLIFWKEAWLKRVDHPAGVAEGVNVSDEVVPDSGFGCTEKDVLAGVYAPGQEYEADPAYMCQATQLPYATTDLPWWDLRQYVEDFTSGNVGLWAITKGSVYATYCMLSNAGLGLGRITRWFYNTFHPLWKGTLFPRSTGTIPVDQPTPLQSQSLNLQPGELVRVKPHVEILKTLNTESKNRGLYFDAEMVPFCSGTYRVLRRVSRILDEKTGKMSRMKTESIILESVFCQARYSHCRMFCPRAIYPYWREIWLERIVGKDAASRYKDL